MRKSILDAEIEVFAPFKGTTDYVAILVPHNVVVRGTSPMEAHNKAKTWQRRAWNDICKPSERVGDGKGFKALAREAADKPQAVAQ